MIRYGLPEFVTFTGPDARTDVDRMVRIAGRFPVEWGLLFSAKRQDQGRYAPLGFMALLADRRQHLAAHVCGAYADEIVDTGRCPAFEEAVARTGISFGRIQVNTSRPFHHGRLAEFAEQFGARLIAQCRGEFPRDTGIDWLHDVSAGTGIVPDARPAPVDGVFGGYAGGLGPHNVAAELAIIRGIVGTKPYWLDMETKVRTDDRFDLDKVEAVLEAVYAAARPHLAIVPASMGAALAVVAPAPGL